MIQICKKMFFKYDFSDRFETELCSILQEIADLRINHEHLRIFDL